MISRCVVCDWWTGGTANDPLPDPPDMGCRGMGSTDTRCAANWLNYDPEDREELWSSYGDYLANLPPTLGESR